MLFLNNNVMRGNYCLTGVFFTAFGVNWKKNYKTLPEKIMNKTRGLLNIKWIK